MKKYSLVMVDDEPAALNYLSTIIAKKCEGFQIVATANNGEEALKLVTEHRPDVLLFDIKMPVMDGLELSQRVKELELPVIMVVVSGYSEFEYARSAMQNGVIDYLLKPVVPSDMKEIFDKIYLGLEEQYFEERIRLLRRLCSNLEVSKDEIEKYFGEEEYFIALARQNGLIKRFMSSETREIYSDIHELMIAYGRDEKESLYLYPKELMVMKTFEQMIQHQAQKENMTQGYETIVYSEKTYDCTQLSHIVSRMYQILDNNIVLGKMQNICLEGYEDKKLEYTQTERSLTEDLKYYIEKEDKIRCQSVLKKLMEVWEQTERPLLWMERKIRTISMEMNERGSNQIEKEYGGYEYLMEEIIANAESFDQFWINVKEILFPRTLVDNLYNNKMDTAEFMEGICGYIHTHLGDALTSQKISREFGISQTYLGKLFRKYRDTSFSSYLTMSRMEKAKEMIEKDPEIMIKEISERMGYKDQFYFSRVFHSYTGHSPSSYIELIKEKQ